MAESETCFEVVKGAEGENGYKLSLECRKGDEPTLNDINSILYKSFDSNLDWALGYARAGFKVLPINYVMEDGFCSCVGKNHSPGDKKCNSDSLGKHPVGFLATQGVHSATTDEETIKMWWARNPKFNVGLHAENFVAMDVDKEEGRDSLLKLDKSNELINPDGSIGMDVPVAKSGREEYGCHVLFKPPKDAIIANRVKFAPGLDFRSFGGYIVVAPSNHSSGNKYKWVKNIFDHELKEMPEWLKTAATSDKVENKTQKRVRKLLASNEKIEKGERNNVLTSLAGAFRNKGLGFNEIRDSLLSINKNRCSEPLENSVIETIANSICKYEVTNKIADVTTGKKPDEYFNRCN